MIPNGARKKKPRREQRGQTFPPVRRVPAQGGVAGDTAPRSAQRKVSASMMAGTHKSLVFLRPAARRCARRACRPAFRPLPPTSRHVHLPRVPPAPHAPR
ncbi:hypothetical protein CBM2615_A330081 [Cupriavidus taiwanensis]|nr:hypothetical protein CBM2615_A330081 [Cupriavidus taiwanensis]